MFINKESLNLALAKQQMNPYEVCRKAGISYETFRKIRNGKKCKPATIGKIAVALNTPVETLVIESRE